MYCGKFFFCRCGGRGWRGNSLVCVEWFLICIVSEGVLIEVSISCCGVILNAGVGQFLIEVFVRIPDSF